MRQTELAALRLSLLENEDTDQEDEDMESERISRTKSWVERTDTLAIKTGSKEACLKKKSSNTPGGDIQVPGMIVSSKAHRRRDEPWGPTLVAPLKLTSDRDNQDAGNPTTAARPDLKSEYSDLAAAIAQAARSLHPITQKQNLELPTFSGSSGDWLPFRAAYEQTCTHLTDHERLAKLRKSLKGVAKDAVKCLFIGETTPEAVMKLLAARFGRPDALVMAELQKLKTLPKLTESPRDICIFASQVTNITATVKALKKEHYLYNPEVVRTVIEKIPATLRFQYYDFITERPEEEPDLLKLSSFLERTAERCGSFASAETSEAERPVNPKRQARTYLTEEQRTTTSAKKTPCPICKTEGHQPDGCPNMKEADPTKRWEIAKTHRLCFRCLQVRRFRHTCKPKKCGKDECTHFHHPLLHNPALQAKEEKPVSVVVTSTREERITTATAMLKVLPVQMTGPTGTCSTYALLDDGSTCTLIEEAMARQIGATGPAESFYIEGIGGARLEAEQSHRIQLQIKGLNSDYFKITARTIRTLDLSPQTVPREMVREFEHLRDLEDYVAHDNCVPTILIGQDNWHLLLTHDLRRGNKNEPVASRTDLGWVLHGIRSNFKNSQRVMRACLREPACTSEDEGTKMEQLMREHFSLESLGVTPKRSYTDGEQRALSLLEDNTRRLPAGGFETCLLWKNDNPRIPENYDNAVKRLHSVEKKLDRDPNMKKRYQRQIDVLLQNNFAEKAPEHKEKRLWYLPHFAVINPMKPEKLRIVHDAAAKTRGTSLNDLLLSGPDLLQSLPGVLMRFRQRSVAITADIKDMFLRIDIAEKERDMQRFLWRGDRREGPPEEYRMKSVIFGATSSPCTAIFVKNKNAESFREQYPEATEAIVKNHYMDDYITSFDTEEEAIRVSNQVALIHSRASFFLQRWASNAPRVVNKLSPERKEEVVQLDAEKILGMVWNPSPDTLTFNLSQHKIPADLLRGERTPTKREALRTVMSLFDPLGLATPVTIQAKRILQDTWRSGINWDEPLKKPEAEVWKLWMQHVQRLPQMAVPRCYLIPAQAQSFELHTFVDASSSTYAALVYWRITNAGGQTHVNLVAAKARVAPISKVTSVPRLELQAAVLGCRLARTAVEEHDIKPTRRFYWSDSRTVLAWLRTGPRAYKPFVAHRVAEIAEETKTAEWRWVPTKLNVADDATRDTPEDFTHNHRWFHGPEFLYSPEEEWPRETENNDEQPTGEERVLAAKENRLNLSEALPDVTRFSSYMRLIRTTARVLQFIDNMRQKKQCTFMTYKRTLKNQEKDPAWRKNERKGKTVRRMQGDDKHVPKFINMEARYMHRAEKLWVTAQQQQLFAEEITNLRQGKRLSSTSRLAPFAVILNEDGLIRLKSRIAAATDISDTQREPAVIDGNHQWTRLYIRWVHTRLHHGGFETTANEVRQCYWVLRLRNAVRSEIQLCQACRLRKAAPAQPSTGNHPPSRLAHHQRPFTYTGLDYFGPMTVTVGRTHQKRYGALFTCLTTRAVHLELVSTLNINSAVMALRRFIARRGCPTEIWSDQGTNLKGADGELRRAAEEAVQEEASVRAISWRYIPPGAPFMGGAWERLVRSVKTALQVTLCERAPKEEVLATLLAEAEHTINSRPLTHVSMLPEDNHALTPNHFLLGGPSRVPQPGAFVEKDVAGHKEWRTSQRLADMFWARWVREYLPELQHRREPRATNGAIKIDDLVLIADGNLPRNVWPRGIVVATFPGPDGEVRAVDVRTTRGILRRPTKKLAIIRSAEGTSPAANTQGSAGTAAAGEMLST